ncbi:MAG: hypothetical protein KJ556_10390 [Gammaproteobacteria bacterium]|nr:hypothetical protein [Gammaproteobacteria bacterium]MBU2058498.1 hypothetical protein [Gammaproteobacteria bacterium]MBU2175523.1 hypothetical protein [Gammaproteobacteria bacterium]MBU2248609.1 hypothetical protein [Gammaproteobacteria bacterium]MBU2342637.1 hypothetical protein [Gammaproteobacteria bacterium]
MNLNKQETLLVGTNNGLIVFQKNQVMDEWDVLGRFLGGNWISSIEKQNDYIVMTSKEGRVSKLSLDDFEIITQDMFDFRLWFSHEVSPGVTAFGGSKDGLYFEKSKSAEYVSLAAIGNERKRWKSHSGNSAHFNTMINNPKKLGELFMSIEEGGVVKSENNGKNWEDITYNLNPDVHTICFGMDNNLYASTGVGIYRYLEKKMEWERFGFGFNSYCQALVYDDINERLVVSYADTPFGRVSNGLFSYTSEKNNFGVCSIERNGSCSIILSSEKLKSGILSKSLSKMGNFLVASTVVGTLYEIDGNNAKKLFDVDENCLVECVFYYAK